MRETQAAASPTSAARPFCSAIQLDLAGPVEINAADPRQGREDLRALPADIGKDVRQYRFAFLVVRGALGGQVVVTKYEEKERLVLAHGEAKNLSSRNPVAEIDEFVARPIALFLERGYVITE